MQQLDHRNGHAAAPLTPTRRVPCKRPKPTPNLAFFYSIADLMALFSVTDRTVWKWCASGRLPKPVRMGRKWSRWPKTQIDALLAEWAEQSR